MNNEYRVFRLKETGKLALRSAIGRANLSIGRDPFASRLVRSLDARGINTVIDVGANVGQYAAMLRASGYTGRLLSVEPLDSAFSILARRCQGDPDWTCLQAAVGAEPGETTINVSANLYSSSLRSMTAAHEAAAPDSVVVGEQPVRVRTLVDIAAEYALDPELSLLKVDTQGFETEVLDGAADLLPRFAAVQLELSSVELYGGQDLYETVAGRLMRLGFELWTLDPGISDEAGRLLQCDALFVRRSDS